MHNHNKTGQRNQKLAAFAYLSALFLGSAILYPILYCVGVIAASDYYLDFAYPSVYTSLTIAVPIVFFSALAGCLLRLFAGRRKLPYLLGYLSAVSSFVLVSQPWKEAAPGVIIGWLEYWDVYIYYLALPVTGLLLELTRTTR